MYPTFNQAMQNIGTLSKTKSTPRMQMHLFCNLIPADIVTPQQSKTEKQIPDLE